MKNLRRSLLLRFKQVSKTAWFQSTLAFCASLYIRFVYHTTRWETIGASIPKPYWDSKTPMIVCFWHGRLLMVCNAWKGANPFYMLISGHSDGEIIAKTVGHFGIHRLRGSATRNPKAAFKQLLQTLKAGQHVGITPDGPRGPCYSVSPGIGRLAYMTGFDVVPLTFSTSSHRKLNTWDQFLLAYPFGRGVFIWGTPLSPKTFSSETDFLNAIKLELTRITEKADSFFS